MDLQIIEKLEDEAEILHKELSDLYETDEKIKSLYRGIHVWRSPIINNPDIMFLGINPGDGYFKKNGKLAYSIKPVCLADYANKNESYNLKWKWNDIFEDELNRFDLLEKSVITNFCYLATENEKALKKLFVRIHNKLNIKPYEFFGNWTKLVVNEIHPKLLICEGTKVLEWLKLRSYPNLYIEEKMSNDMFNIGHISDIKVFTVSRDRKKMFSKKSTADELRKLFDEVYI